MWLQLQPLLVVGSVEKGLLQDHSLQKTQDEKELILQLQEGVEEEEAQATTSKVAELEAKFKEIVAWDGEIFIQGQDSIKKELVNHFPVEDFS